MPKFNHVCVIDDDPIYTYAADRAMKKIDFYSHVEFFKNGQEALNSLIPRLNSGRNIPDIIFLDLDMPIMDGWQFLDELIGILDKKMFIYLVTSSIAPEDIERAKQYSLIDKFVAKPITPEILQNLFNGTKSTEY